MKHSLTGDDHAPLVVGTGLLALDDVRTDGAILPPRYWAGGTCGNVLLALRYLGWEAAPVARLRPGVAADHILKDLGRWGVADRFISLEDDGSTPIIVHWIGRTLAGQAYHSFSWRCPSCGHRLPGYKPVLASTSRDIAELLGTPQVFFFDRVSRGALLLASESAARGAAVVFEPSSIGHPGLFREAWALADVVKFSHERLKDLSAEVDALGGARLVIETLGREGLRYRSSLLGSTTRGWRRMDALDAADVKDTAGAGDWCTAGIAHKLLDRGSAGLEAATATELRDAIRYGQALAAWNCAFEGARGGMYGVKTQGFDRQVQSILEGKDHGKRQADELREAVRASEACLCPVCEKAGSPPCKSRGSRSRS